MTIYKHFIKLSTRNVSVFLFSAIFIIILFVNTQNSSTDFSKIKPRVYLYGENNQTYTLVKGYLSRISELDEQMSYDEALNFIADENIDVMVEIKSDGQIVLHHQEIKQNASYIALELNKLKMFKNAFLTKDPSISTEELQEKVISVLSKEVKVSTLIEEKKTDIFSILGKNTYSLAALVLSIYVYSNHTLRSYSISQRQILSPLSQKSITLQIMLAQATLITIISLILTIVVYIRVTTVVDMLEFGKLYLATLLYSIAISGIGIIVGQFKLSINSINGVVNVLSLVTSAFSGGMIPLSYLPEYLVNISKFYPTYYITSLGVNPSLYTQNMLVLGLFIIVFGLIAMYTSKTKDLKVDTRIVK